jgi:ATP-dependent DNA ligase
MCDEVEDIKIDFSKFCKLAKSWKDNMKLTGDYILMPKMDGVRLVTEINPFDWQVNLYSRNGKEKSLLLKKLRNIIRDKMVEEEFPNVILDGELLIYDTDGELLPMRTVQTIFGRKNEYNENLDISKLEYNIFDCYFPRYPDMKFSVRLTALEDIIKKIDNPQYKMIPYDIIQAPFDINNLTITDGAEGLMLMSDVPYPVGKRNNSTLKIKQPQKQLTGIVTNAEYGTGKNVDRLSKFEISIMIGDFLVPICWTGSGLTEADLVYLNENEHLGLIFEIKYDFGQGTSLRFPVVDTIRHDLGREDITVIKDYAELNYKRM